MHVATEEENQVIAREVFRAAFVALAKRSEDESEMITTCLIAFSKAQNAEIAELNRLKLKYGVDYVSTDIDVCHIVCSAFMAHGEDEDCESIPTNTVGGCELFALIRACLMLERKFEYEYSLSLEDKSIVYSGADEVLRDYISENQGQQDNNN